MQQPLTKHNIMNYKSIVIGALYFYFLFFTSSYLIDFLINDYPALTMLTILFVWCSPGYLVASIAKRHAVIHASLSGALCYAFATAVTYALDIGGFTIELAYTLLATAIVSFGFGALIWSFKSWLTQRKTQ